MKTAKQLLQKYESNKKLLMAVENNYEKYTITKRAKAIKKKNKLNERINALEMKLVAIDEKLNKKINRKQDKKDEIINKLKKQINNFEKIVKMLRVKTDDDSGINDTDISKSEYYKNDYLKWINGYIFDDKFLKIRLIICKTYRRSVCKYSVLAVGRTPFKKYMKMCLNKSSGYGLNHIDLDKISFIFPLRHFSSTERAEKWIKRNKDYILSDMIDEHNKIKAKYLATIRNYRKKDNLMELIEAKEMAEKL